MLENSPPAQPLLAFSFPVSSIIDSLPLVSFICEIKSDLNGHFFGEGCRGAGRGFSGLQPSNRVLACVLFGLLSEQLLAVSSLEAAL